MPLLWGEARLPAMSLPVMERTFRDVERVVVERLPAGTAEWVHFHRFLLEIAVELAEDHLSVRLEGSQGS